MFYFVFRREGECWRLLRVIIEVDEGRMKKEERQRVDASDIYTKQARLAEASSLVLVHIHAHFLFFFLSLGRQGRLGDS
jgi:hypothetical protein